MLLQSRLLEFYAKGIFIFFLIISLKGIVFEFIMLINANKNLAVAVHTLPEGCNLE